MRRFLFLVLFSLFLTFPAFSKSPENTFPSKSKTEIMLSPYPEDSESSPSNEFLLDVGLRIHANLHLLEFSDSLKNFASISHLSVPEAAKKLKELEKDRKFEEFACCFCDYLFKGLSKPELLQFTQLLELPIEEDSDILHWLDNWEHPKANNLFLHENYKILTEKGYFIKQRFFDGGKGEFSIIIFSEEERIILKTFLRIGDDNYYFLRPVKEELMNIFNSENPQPKGSISIGYLRVNQLIKEDQNKIRTIEKSR